jgi:hypothetical protein
MRGPGPVLVGVDGGGVAAVPEVRRERQQVAVGGAGAVTRWVSGGWEPPERGDPEADRRLLRLLVARYPEVAREALAGLDEPGGDSAAPG